MKRLGLVLASLVAAVFIMVDGAWAAKCLDNCCGRSARRARCCVIEPFCCGEVICGVCCEMACEPTVCGCDALAPAPAAPTLAPVPVKPAETVKPAIPLKPMAPAPAAPVEPPKPLAPVKVAPPAEKPAEAPVPPKPPAPQPPKPAEKKADAPAPAKPVEEKKASPAAPAKPAEEKKAAPPAKKVSATHRLRVWTDSTGNYQVVARFVTMLDNGSVVRLVRADGTCVRVALNRLSAEDQRVVLGQSITVAWNW